VARVFSEVVEEERVKMKESVLALTGFSIVCFIASLSFSVLYVFGYFVISQYISPFYQFFLFFRPLFLDLAFILLCVSVSSALVAYMIMKRESSQV
jgi:hypothetical protein